MEEPSSCAVLAGPVSSTVGSEAPKMTELSFDPSVGSDFNLTYFEVKKEDYEKGTVQHYYDTGMDYTTLPPYPGEDRDLSPPDYLMSPQSGVAIFESKESLFESKGPLPESTSGPTLPSHRKLTGKQRVH